MRVCRKCLHNTDMYVPYAARAGFEAHLSIFISFTQTAENHVLKQDDKTLIDAWSFPRTIDARTKMSLVSEMDATLVACKEAMDGGMDVLTTYVKQKRRAIWNVHDVSGRNDPSVKD